MAKNPEKMGRIAQIRQTFSMTRKQDPSILWMLPLASVGTLVVFLVAAALLLGAWQYGLLLGIPTALLVGLYLFGNRAEKAAYGAIAGQPGAAAAALNSLRKGWFTTPFVEVTRNQDAVHRVIGRPGIVLVAEAPASRAKPLLATARARTARFAGDAPIHEVICGEGGVKLTKLNRTVMKLPRVLRPAEVTELRRKMDAVQKGPSLPIPRGPMPKGMRMPRPK
ncbi:MAG: DUF4191 domain-containing protein [Candidatus Nanopelagicales bacterium]